MYSFRIILEAAFSLHDRTFLENIGSILLFSVVVSIIFYLKYTTQVFAIRQDLFLPKDPRYIF